MKSAFAYAIMIRDIISKDAGKLTSVVDDDFDKLEGILARYIGRVTTAKPKPTWDAVKAKLTPEEWELVKPPEPVKRDPLTNPIKGDVFKAAGVRREFVSDTEYIVTNELRSRCSRSDFARLPLLARGKCVKRGDE